MTCNGILIVRIIADDTQQPNSQFGTVLVLPRTSTSLHAKQHKDKVSSRSPQTTRSCMNQIA
jgi:hypothetical protein